jgi:hypothetical protein
MYTKFWSEILMGRDQSDDLGVGKVKVSLCFFLTGHHAMKAYWKSSGITPRVIVLGTRGT